MATVIITNLIDSLDETVTEGVETVTFFHPETGQKMEIELGEKNRAKFKDAFSRMNRFINAAEPVVEPEPVKASGPKSDLTAVREWARANGYTVGDRGRIKAEIIEAYRTSLILGSPDDPDTDSDDVVAPASEAEATVALDGETQVIDTDTDSEPISEAAFLEAVNEVNAEGNEPTLAAVAAKVDSTQAS